MAVAACALAFAFTLAAPATAQQKGHITTPKEALGFVPGDDYRLANYTQLAAWWNKLANESDRCKLVDMGKTEEGRPQYMMIVSSPDNIRNLAKYQGIVKKLALAEGVTDAEARTLASQGKAVVWIDGGLHASEIVNSHQLMMLVYDFLTKNDPETTRILNDVILLAVQPNPDGQELVADWYMRKADEKKRSYSDLPKLYNKYIGHDDNRDFYMSAMSETTNMNKVMFYDWFPQIMYNHHQTGPQGVIIAIPPFRDPFNYNFDPMIITELNMLGAAMQTRYVTEGKPGFAYSSQVSYSTWYNGGLRTICYFHNIVGILSEIKGSPTPMDLPLIVDRQQPRVDNPLPMIPTTRGQKWHFSQAIEYSLTADRAILDLASRYKETFLYNQYVMGRNSIQKGSKDTWNITPSRVAALAKAAKAEEKDAADPFGRNVKPADPELYNKVLHDPAYRDPRVYIVTADQADFPTATKFINAFIKNGIVVMKATSAFSAGGKRYPAGSWVIKTNQPFRPHIIDMFEPQDHPNDFTYPGGPPVPPYDVAGWTLAYQMGVQFDRVLDDVKGPFQTVQGLQGPPAGKLTGVSQPAGYLISHQLNDSFIVVNRLLKAGAPVFWLKAPVPVAGKQQGPGTIWVPASANVRGILEKSTSLGVSAEGVSRRPAGEAMQLKPVRVGLWDQYGGSMPSGWIRWMFEQFELPYQMVYPQGLDAGNLASKFDVIVLPSGALPGGRESAQPTAEEIPAEYRYRLGKMSVEKTVPQLKAFVQAGGTVIGLGDSSKFGLLMGVPAKDALVETVNGKERRLRTTKFYIPGSVLRAAVDTSDPMAYGMPSQVDIYFQNNEAYTLASPGPQAKRVVWFSNANPLRSGWAWGQSILDNKVEAISSQDGRRQRVPDRV